ncbi:hypothetical protein [Chryseobacterium koreense]
MSSVLESFYLLSHLAQKKHTNCEENAQVPTIAPPALTAPAVHTVIPVDAVAFATQNP